MSATAPIPPQIGPARRRLAIAGALIVLVLLALAARAPYLNLYPTQDEDNWVERAAEFRTALARHDWRGTYRSGHPGVTTMWLASLGMGDLSAPLVTRTERWVTRVPEFMTALEAARHVMLGFEALLIALIAALMGRLSGWGAGLVAGALLAFDPFFVAHGQLVHLDALVSGLMMVALLSALVYWTRGGNRLFFVLSAIAGGLAFVTKAPAAVLVPAIPVIAALGLRPWRSPRTFGWWALGTALWGLLAAVTMLAIWPALLTNPIDTVNRLLRFAAAEGGQPHGPGNFFLGKPVAIPGPMFYPLALALRLSPPVLVGLFCLVALPWRDTEDHRSRAPVWVLIAGAVFFVVVMSLGAKKLDRYVLPAIPALLALAGLGLWRAGVALRNRRPWLAAAPALVLLLQPISLLSAEPYPLSYYSPLAGGGPAAERTMLVGWGEGLDQVATYLNAQPDADSMTIAVYFPLTVNFQAQVRGTVVGYGPNVRPTYVVDYVNAHQRGQFPAEIIGRDPDLVTRINGIEYARVFRLLPPP